MFGLWLSQSLIIGLEVTGLEVTLLCMAFSALTPNGTFMRFSKVVSKYEF